MEATAVTANELMVALIRVRDLAKACKILPAMSRTDICMEMEWMMEEVRPHCRPTSAPVTLTPSERVVFPELE